MACRLSRLIKLIRIVRGKSFPSVDDLCRIFQIKERTLFNDLKELREELGVEIQFDRTRQGYFLASDIAEINLITLTEETAILLLAAFGMLSFYGGASFSEPLQNIFNEEITLCLNGTRTGANSSIFQHDGNTTPSIDMEIFLGISRACFKSKSVIASIHTAALQQLDGYHVDANSEQTIIKILPTRLIFSSDGWRVCFNSDSSSATQLHLSGIKNLIST